MSGSIGPRVYIVDPDILLWIRDLTGSIVSMLTPLVVECGDAKLTASREGPGVIIRIESSLSGVSVVNTLGDGSALPVRPGAVRQ